MNSFLQTARRFLVPGSLALFAVVAPADAQVLEVMTNDPASSPDRFFYFARQNNNHHRPRSFITEVRRDFGERGIQFTTFTNLEDLTLENLGQYDGAFFFGNHGTISEAQSKAIFDYVEGGGGMVGMHVTTYVVIDNPILRPLLGAQFWGHDSIQSFTPSLINSPSQFPEKLQNHEHHPFAEGGSYQFDPDHPILNGLKTYTSFDEPYLHRNLNPDLILLGYRSDAPRDWDEPYTWVRHQGDGRVFYHANGHDSRTWSEPNFRELMIRGAEWVAKPRGLQFASLSPPLLAPNGDCQYPATTSDGSGEALPALYSDRSQSALDGTQMPGEDELFRHEFGPESRHSLLEDGNMILVSDYRYRNSGGRAILAGHPRYPSMIAWNWGEADDLEAGFVYAPNQRFPFVTNQRDTTIFRVRVQDSAGGNRMFAYAQLREGGLDAVLMESDPVPGSPDLIVTDLPDQSFLVGPAGRFAASAALEDSQAPGEQSSLVAGKPGGLSAWLKAGDPIAGLPGDLTLADFQKPIAFADESLIFMARVEGPGVTSGNEFIVASTDADGHAVLLFRKGQDIDGQNISFDSPSRHFPYREGVAVIGESEGRKALIHLTGHGVPRVLISEGQSLAAVSGSPTIKELDLSSLMANESQVVLPAVLGQPDDEREDRRVLLQLGPALIRPVLAPGDLVETNTGVVALTDFACRPDDGGGDGLNPSHELAVHVTLADTREAILRIPNLDDLDQDGFSDLLETAFGGDPNTSGQRSLPGFPVMASNEEGDSTIHFWQKTTPVTPLDYQIQGSEDLVGWVDLDPPTESTADQSGLAEGYQKMAADLTGLSSYRFFRIEIR